MYPNNINTADMKIEDIKDKVKLLSQIESYSILEKINEWKKEEGIPVSSLSRKNS